jgi:hypothetical protein
MPEQSDFNVSDESARAVHRVVLQSRETAAFLKVFIMKYKHFKGGVYDFVCEAKLESNPQITMVVYKSNDGSAWVRPRDVFFELLELDGKLVRRFEPIN